MIGIYGGLGVVPLNPAVRSLEGVAVGIGEVPLGGWLGVAGCIGGKHALRHRHGIQISREHPGLIQSLSQAFLPVLSA